VVKVFRYDLELQLKVTEALAEDVGKVWLDSIPKTSRPSREPWVTSRNPGREEDVARIKGDA